jgi:hypothetical protein
MARARQGKAGQDLRGKEKVGQLQGVGYVECYMDAMYIASTPLEKKNHNALRMLYGALNSFQVLYGML